MDVAAANVTDGYNDNGLDAMYYSTEDRTLYLCQSKWSNDGSGSIDLGDTEKFISGVKDILSLRLERFNKRIDKRKATIEDAVNQTMRLQLCVVYSGSDRLGDHSKRVLKDLLAELNTALAVFSFP